MKQRSRGRTAGYEETWHTGGCSRVTHLPQKAVPHDLTEISTLYTSESSLEQTDSRLCRAHAFSHKTKPSFDWQNLTGSIPMWSKRARASGVEHASNLFVTSITHGTLFARLQSPEWMSGPCSHTFVAIPYLCLTSPLLNFSLLSSCFSVFFLQDSDACWLLAYR
jgi:hypothetical protein